MRYNRTDFFRYQFSPSLPAIFRLQLNNEEHYLSNEAKCEILDISTGGAKFFAHLDLPIRSNKVAVQLEFTLYKQPLEVLGNIVWKKEEGRGFEYGFDFDLVEKQDSLIINELKQRAHQEKEQMKLESTQESDKE